MAGVGEYGAVHRVEKQRPRAKTTFDSQQRRAVIDVDEADVRAGERVGREAAEQAERLRSEIDRVEIRRCAPEKKRAAQRAIAGRGRARRSYREDVVRGGAGQIH